MFLVDKIARIRIINKELNFVLSSAVLIFEFKRTAQLIKQNILYRRDTGMHAYIKLS